MPCQNTNLFTDSVFSPTLAKFSPLLLDTPTFSFTRGIGWWQIQKKRQLPAEYKKRKYTGQRPSTGYNSLTAWDRHRTIQHLITAGTTDGLHLFLDSRERRKQGYLQVSRSVGNQLRGKRHRWLPPMRDGPPGPDETGHPRPSYPNGS